MPEHVRRVTAGEIGPNKNGIVQIGQGQSADVFLDFAHPGICLKIPNSWSDNEAAKIESAYKRMQGQGFPVLPYFNVAWGGEYYEMTDLTDGLRNLVVSLPDIHRVDEPAQRRQWFNDWRSVRPVNLREFGEELNGIVHLAADTATPINSVGFFLQATPTGTLHTFIADYEDGILHHEVGKPFDDQAYRKQLERAKDYLEVVANFFPAVSGIRLS